MPEHTYGESPYDKFGSRASVSGKETQGSGDYRNTADEYGTGRMWDQDWVAATEKPRGGSQPHNNIQPSIITRVWERIG